MKLATIILPAPAPEIGSASHRMVVELGQKYDVQLNELRPNQLSVLGRLSDVRRFVRELAVNDFGSDWLDEPLECICERYGDELGVPTIELIYDTQKHNGGVV